LGASATVSPAGSSMPSTCSIVVMPSEPSVVMCSIVDAAIDGSTVTPVNVSSTGEVSST
jgi:hypothetical protein